MDKEYKIYVIGAGDFPIYEKALYDGFLELGLNRTKLITWRDSYRTENAFFKALTRLEFHYGMGMQTSAFNKYLTDLCEKNKPDMVFLYSCRMILPETVKRIKSLGTYVASYCNDDPFSRKYRKSFWKNYRDSLKFCDINYVYRHSNITDVKEITGIPGKLLRAYYIEGSNYPCRPEEMIPGVPDVIFLGHMEDDERLEYLEALIENGVKIGLNEAAYSEWAKGKENIVFLENPRTWYNRYLCSCKIPLVFLSNLNRDTYTRRCFEIPAAGAFLFCPYTDDLAAMYEEDKEIVFYRSKEDFIDKTMYYLKHDSERKQIATAGRERLLRDGHEVKDRVQDIITNYKKQC